MLCFLPAEGFGVWVCMANACGHLFMHLLTSYASLDLCQGAPHEAAEITEPDLETRPGFKDQQEKVRGVADSQMDASSHATPEHCSHLQVLSETGQSKAVAFDMIDKVMR